MVPHLVIGELSMNNRADKTAKARPAQTAQERENDFNNQRGFILETEVVIREKAKIPFDEKGTHTIGQMIDRQLAGLARDDGEMRHFGITFDEASWNDAKEAYKELDFETIDRGYTTY